MEELISEEDLIKWKVNAATFNIELAMLVRLKANQRHEEAMERYKALLEATNEPDVEAWESKMKERAIEFAERWLITNTIDHEDIRIEESYNKIYGSTHQA